MLDEKDLQAIGQLIDAKLDAKLDEKLDAKLNPIREDISDLRTTVTGMKGEISDLQTTVTGMKEDISDLRTTVTRVAVTQENDVLRGINLLAEGHETLLNTLARKDRVEALEADVSLLKTALQAMSLQIAELQKAQ